MQSFSADKERFLPALLFFAAVLVPVSFFSVQIAAGRLNAAYPAAWALFTALTGFFIIYTGKVSFYRRIFFGASAALFLVHFKLSLFSAFASVGPGEAPYCHIIMASSFFNYFYQQYLAFMSGDFRLWGPLSAAFLWLFFTLVLGRAWCSWACFAGGIDDLLSALPAHALIKTRLPAGRFRDFPAALLIFMLLVSLAQMLPVYCLWLCPFKLTPVFLDQDAFIRKIQLGLMFFALAVLLLGPLLTKKRTFCSFLCPFGAWQAFWGRLNPFRVTVVDTEECAGCFTCLDSCPMYAIKAGPDGKPERAAYCNLCGECLAACPNGRLSYSVFGLRSPDIKSGFGRLLTPESFLVFSALVTGGTFAALFAPAALKDAVDLLRRLGHLIIK